METTAINKESILEVLATVMDPEIPVLSLLDLGMITDVRIESAIMVGEEMSRDSCPSGRQASSLKAGLRMTEGDKIIIQLLPTFTACPAIKYMQNDILQKMKVAGYENVAVVIDKENKWTSDRLNEKGKKALENFGLSTPPVHGGNITESMITQSKCPHCGSTNTTLNSLFGSTLCRSIHFCFDCKQGFERFKPVG